MTATQTILQGQVLSPAALALLDAIVGVGKPVPDETVPAALATLVAARLVGSGIDGQVTPTEAGVRCTAPRFMKGIN